MSRVIQKGRSYRDRVGLPRGAMSESESHDEIDEFVESARIALKNGNEQGVRAALGAIGRIVGLMRSQLKNGVHVNPLMAVFGNPGTCFSDNVMAVLYVHKDDGEHYCHGFGDADLKLTTHRDGSVTLHGLKTRTGVKMIAEGPAIRLEKRGVALSKEF